MLNCQQVDLRIHHSWDQTKKVSKKLINLESRSEIASMYGNSEHIKLGNMGVLSKHELSESWYRIASPIVNSTMPWLSDMLDAMSILKPDDGVISLMNGIGAEHIDLPHMQTALNFIFDNSDDTAYTWVKDHEHYEQYPSVINTAWILDTQKLHGIVNKGERWALSIHFNTDYAIVKDWFDKHPQLIFGKT